MKKIICILALVIVAMNSMGGLIGLPLERIALPVVQGSHLVCVWDETAGDWLRDFESYDKTGIYEFQIPATGNWYWVGLWDESRSEYVFGKWIGHFVAQ